MNYDRFLSDFAKRRKPSGIKKYASSPQLGLPYTLDAGFPNHRGYPIQEITVTLTDGSKIDISGQLMRHALNYGPSRGFPDLISQVKDLVKRVHNPPLWNEEKAERGRPDVTMCAGALDGLGKAINVLVNPGDYILLQEPAYATFLAALSPYNVKPLAMVEDEHGIDPGAVRKVLSSKWTPEQCRSASTGVPKVMYLVPSASNPSGTMLGLERKKELYKIAHDYNLLIMEDDPYYFINFTGDYEPSLLSLDVDGRVLRFDSFSKFIAAGLRVGYVTGPQPIIDAIDNLAQSSGQSSTLSQIIISEVMKSWGEEGLMKHIKSAQQIYKEQCEQLVHYADKWLTGLAEWNVPKGGMFLWVKVHGVKDTVHLVVERANKKGVTVIPGVGFVFSSPQSPHLRVSFSNISIENMDKALQLLAEAIKEEVVGVSQVLIRK